MRTSNRPANPPSAPRPTGGTIFHLVVVLGVAFLLATLFTAWTPGEFAPRERPYESTGTSQASVPSAQPLIYATGNPTATLQIYTNIGIVAGHWGGNDSGAVCSDGLREVDVNLNIASLAQKYLAEQGYTVDLLKEFDPRLTNYAAAALVSIHADSCDYINDQASGYKVAAAIGNQRPERAARLTSCLRHRYNQFTGLPLHSTSITNDMTFYHAFDEIDDNTPAAIIETGFMNLDRQFLTQTPELAAQGIAAGILCFINNESITPATPQLTP